MRAFFVPAAYRRHIEDAIQCAIDEAARDQWYRKDEDERVQQFASVPPARIEPNATGTLMITIEETAILLSPTKAAS